MPQLIRLVAHQIVVPIQFIATFTDQYDLIMINRHDHSTIDNFWQYLD